MTRRVVSAILGALTCAVVLGACGGGDTKRDGAGTKPAGRSADVFDVAAQGIAASSTALFIRGDDAHVDDAERSIRAVAGGRTILNELPKRSQLAELGLLRLGFTDSDARALAPLVRRDVVVVRAGSGWTLVVGTTSDATDAARAFVEARPDRSTLTDGILRVSTDVAAWNVPLASTSGNLADVERWNRIAASETGRAAIVIGVDRGRVLALRADGSGFRMDGRLGAPQSCRSSADAVDALAQLPVESVAVATTRSDGSGGDSLRSLLEHSATTVRAIGAFDIGSGRLDRVRDSLVASAIALVEMPIPELDADAVAVRDAGGRAPRVVAATGASGGTLADAPGFAAARAAAEYDSAGDAWWIDLDAVIRAAAAARLSGIERGVVDSLGAGIDGVLAWQTCDGQVGARVAIQREG